MVSGFVTSPCDQLRIFSGDARLMRMASKSAIVFCISNGLERNKVFLRFLLSRAVASGQFFMFRGSREPLLRETVPSKFFMHLPRAIRIHASLRACQFVKPSTNLCTEANLAKARRFPRRRHRLGFHLCPDLHQKQSPTSRLGELPYALPDQLLNHCAKGRAHLRTIR